MNRRKLFALCAGAGLAWSKATRAQQPAVPTIGFLRSTRLADAKAFIEAFESGLKQMGFVEGQNVAIETRAAEGEPDRLTGMVGELISRQVNVLVGDAVAMLVAKAATRTIPIVFAVGGDPVQQGLVSSLNRPEGNVTGVHFFAGVLGPKRLELLRQVAPTAWTIAVLIHPNTPNTEAERTDILAAAKALGQPLLVMDVSSNSDIDMAFEAFVNGGAGALLVGSGPVMTAQMSKVIAFASRHGLPACYHLREAVSAGGLMSYGASVSDAYHQAGLYAGRILKGEKPADLPVVRSSKFELAINRKTAATLGIEIPSTLLATADEVIE